MMPVIARIIIIAIPEPGDFSTILSAMRAGTFEYIKRAAIIILPI